MMLRGMHPSVRPNISAYLDAEGNVILEKLTKYERGIYDAVQGLVRLGERMWQALNVPVQGLTGKTLGDLGDYVSKQGLSEEDPVARIMRRGVPGSPTFSLQDHALAATHADLFDSMLSQWNVMAAGGDPRALDTDPLSQYSDYLAGLGSAYTRWGIKQYLLEHWPTYAQISAQYGEKGLAEVKDWLPFTGVKGPGAEALAQIPLPAPVRAFLSNLYMEGSLVPELKGGGFLRMLSRPFSVGMLLTRKFLIPQFLQQPLTAHLSGTDLTSHPREGAEALYLIPKVFALRSLRSFGHVSPRSAADKILYGAAVAAMKLRPLSAEGLAKAEMYRDEMNKYGISSGSLAHSAARWEEGTLRAALVKGLHLSRADKELRPLMRLATQFFFAADDYGRSYIYIVQRELGNTPAQAARAVADWTPTYSPEYSALIDNYLGEFALYYKYSRQVYGQMMRLAFQRPGLLLLMIRAKQLEDLGMGYDEEWQNLMSAGADPQKWGQFEYRHWRWDLWPATMFPKELLPPFPPKPLTQAEIDAGVPPRKPGGVLVAYKGQPVLSMRTRFQFFEIAGEWAQLATGGAKAWLRRANPILGSGDTLAQRGVAKTLQNLPIVSNFYRKFSRTAPGQRASADFLTAWAKQGISTEEVVRRGLTPKDAIAPLFMRDPSNAETRRLAAKAHVSPTRVWFYYEVEMTNLLLGRAKLESYGISHDVEWTGVMLARMALPGLERQKVLAQEKLARGETPLYTPREIDAYIEKRQGATSTKERKATPGALAPAKR